MWAENRGLVPQLPHSQTKKTLTTNTRVPGTYLSAEDEHLGAWHLSICRTPGCLAPIYLRLSVTDWVEGGVTLDESIELIRQLKTAGLDMIDVSHGMVTPNVDVPWAPGMMIAPAGRIRREANTARPICAWGVALARVKSSGLEAGPQYPLVCRK